MNISEREMQVVDVELQQVWKRRTGGRELCREKAELNSEETGIDGG